MTGRPSWKQHPWRWLLPVLVARGLVACSSSDATQGLHDAATDAEADAPSDAATDAGADAGPDTATDAGADAGPDTATDAGADTATDAGADATPDAAPEPPGAPTDVVAAAVPVVATVTTLAGSGAAAFADGTGAAASFDSPSGLTVDAAGNVYVADKYNHRIRKVTAAGVVTTLAGSGSGEFADGTGTAAGFTFPSDVALDAAGNVYVADKFSYRVRKVTAAGVVTTLAGSGTPSVVDGTGTAAGFTTPLGIAADVAGDLYVSDVGVTGVDNNRIRKVTAAGVVTTLAGSAAAAFADGTGAAARFNYPVGVAVDAAGNVFVADAENHRIRKVTAAGVVTTLAGSGTPSFADGTGAAAGFSYPFGVAVDGAGNVYVADFYNNRIRRVTAAGVVTTLAGSDASGADDGAGAAASFNYPFGVAVDGAGSVYVGDYSNHRIRKLAVVGVGQVAVSWSPGAPGSSPITGYVASATAAGHATRTCATDGGPTSCTIGGLTSGVAYGVSVTATNAAGAGAPSGSTTATPN